MKQCGKKGESCRNFATKPNGILVIANSAPTPINCSQIERIRYPGKFDFKTITIITIIEASSTDMNADES